MTSGSIWRSLLGFSIPIMFSNLVQSTYNAVDMLFVGRFTGTESLAAVSVCGPIMNVMIITLSGMSAGVLVVISGLLGAGDIKQAQDAAHTSVALYALMAAVMTVLGLLFVPQILRLVQTPAAAMPEAKRYLYTVFAGTVFTFGYNLIGALQRGLGNAAASMAFVSLSSAANIALDAVFIVWLGMGAFGAALGTSSSVPMFHVIGVTPEAPDLASAFGGRAPRRTLRVGRERLRDAWRELDSAGETRIDLVALGNPHFSASEFAQLAALCHGRRRHPEVALVITSSRQVVAQAEAAGHLATLQAFGARLVTDTCWCMLDEPLVPPGARTLMTNSAKYAHYAPGLVGRQVRFAGLAGCVEAAVGGRAPAGLPAWLSEDC